MDPIVYALLFRVCRPPVVGVGDGDGVGDGFLLLLTVIPNFNIKPTSSIGTTPTASAVAYPPFCDSVALDNIAYVVNPDMLYSTYN